ncbi:MAG: nitroreductase family protein [Deltaproteobacteria bacterium]|nr:nitroreductase family protein [Deltaproteobacteria bacterium]
MERKITVDKERCVHCGLCVGDCVAYCLELGDDKMPRYRQGAEERCIVCQHCMAVCPAGALSFGGLNPDDSAPVACGDSDALLRLIQSRRSMRHFKDEGIPAEALAKITAMLPFTPTASNADSLHFSIVAGREKMTALRRATYAKEPFANIGDSPGRRIYREKIASGEDIIYRDAPVMIAVAAEKERTAPPHHGIVDAAIALTFVDLYAQSLGLGAVWCGLALHAALQIPEVLALLEIPEEYALCYTMLLGVPAVKYARTVQPEPFSMKVL